MGTLPLQAENFSRSAIGRKDDAGARYFDYESAVALRHLAAAYGTDMPRYLLAPEVAVLLAHMPDPRKRLFTDTLWNTGGRLNEVLALTPGDFALDDPATGRPLAAPFAVLHTLKQQREHDALRRRGRGRPTKEAQQAAREVQDRPPRAVPLTDPGYVQRLRDWLAGAGLKKHERLWAIRSEDTARSWIKAAVMAAERDGVTLTVRPVTPKTFRDSFAMHLVQHGVPQKVLQAMLGHKKAESTEWYTRVLALDVTRQLGVTFSVDAEAAWSLLAGAGTARLLQERNG